MNQFVNTSESPVPQIDWLEPEVPLDEDFSFSALFLPDSCSLNNFSVDYIYRLEDSCLI